MKNSLQLISSLRFPFGMAIAIAIWTSLSQAQTLPTGMNAVPFYDTSLAGLSFRKDQIPVTGMWEVPGKPKHFLVLGYFGFIWKLYPDTTRPDTVMPYGSIKRYTRTQIADFNNRTVKGWEQGALGAAFDPYFLINHRFYVIYSRYPNPANYHTGTTGSAIQGPGDGTANSVTVAVDRYIMSSDFNTLVRDTTIIAFDHGTGLGSCNLAFGMDGMMYITAAAYNTNSWDSTIFERKILRIDVSRQDSGKMYAIPTDNPWYNATNPLVKKEVYAFGFHNTYSLTENYLSATLWGADPQESRWEEINNIFPGRNYGWANGGSTATVYGTNSLGVEGPCSSNTASGGGFTSTSATSGNSASFMNPYSRTFNGRTYTCADLTNPTWSFSHSGATTDGIATAAPGLTPMVAVAISPVFRGAVTSPFYGYQFITDIWQNNFLAVKTGQTIDAPVNVGGVTGITFAGDKAHNGITTFSEDSYGNLYVIMLSSSTTGAYQWHDILRMNHAQLTPLTEPRAQVISMPIGDPFGPTSIFSSSHKVRADILVANTMAGMNLKIPTGYSGVELYNVKGRMVWSYRGTESEIHVPSALEMGILQARFVR